MSVSCWPEDGGTVITGGGKWVELTARRPAIPASAADRGEEVLALRDERRRGSSVQCSCTAVACDDSGRVSLAMVLRRLAYSGRASIWSPRAKDIAALSLFAK